MTRQPPTGFAGFPAALRRGGRLAARTLAFARAEIVLLAILFVTAGGCWAFIVLADEVGEGETATFDRALLLAFRDPADLSDPIGPAWVEEMMRDVTAMGSHFVLIVITLSVIGFLLLSGKRGAALLVFVSVGGGMLLSTVLKMGFERPRPDLVQHGARVFTASFPSGHATLAAVAYLTIGALLARFEDQRRLKIYYLVVAALLTASVGVSRVYLGVHWPTDVLAGWAIGAAWAMGVWLVALLLQRFGKVEQPGETNPPA